MAIPDARPGHVPGARGRDDGHPDAHEGSADPRANGHSNGRVDGGVDGRADGHANGGSNGHANGGSNGGSNGHVPGRANGHEGGRGAGTGAPAPDDGRFLTRRERRQAEEAASGPAPSGPEGDGPRFAPAAPSRTPSAAGAVPAPAPGEARRPTPPRPRAAGRGVQAGPGDGDPGVSTRAVFPPSRTSDPLPPAGPALDDAGSGAGRPPRPPSGGSPRPSDGPGGGADVRPPSLGRRLLHDAREVLGTVAVALGIAIVIKTFLVQPFKIPSQSMEETLLVGDRVLVSKLEPGPLSLQRGDVVVFLDPGDWLDTPTAEQSLLNQALTFIGLLPANSGEHLIKRVIGLPGDTVACCDVEGRVLVNNQPLDEDYLYPGDQPSREEFTVTVPEGRIWVMGDHRGVSQDSREHGTADDPAAGAVPLENVVGRAVLVSWPLSRWDWLGRPEGVFDGVGGLDGVR